jgi:cystathionine gamma-synthase
LGGVVCGNKSLVEKIYHYREINGAALAPWDAYLLVRGMKTLKLRVLKQAENAIKIAEYLQKNERVESVYYPGLKDHVHHDIAKKQMKGFGGMLSFALKGGMDSVSVLLPALKYANCAANLGSVETTYGPARTTSHVEVTPEERKAIGLAEGLVRVSVGIEDIEDLLADLEQAFAYLEKSFRSN